MSFCTLQYKYKNIAIRTGIEMKSAYLNPTSKYSSFESWTTIVLICSYLLHTLPPPLWNNPLKLRLFKQNNNYFWNGVTIQSLQNFKHLLSKILQVWNIYKIRRKNYSFGLLKEACFLKGLTHGIFSVLKVWRYSPSSKISQTSYTENKKKI